MIERLYINIYTLKLLFEDDDDTSAEFYECAFGFYSLNYDIFIY